MPLKQTYSLNSYFLSLLQGTFALGRLIAIPCATRFTAAFMLLCNLVCIPTRFICLFICVFIYFFFLYFFVPLCCPTHLKSTQNCSKSMLSDDKPQGP